MGMTDWIVLVAFCAASLVAGLWFARRSSRSGAEGYFTGERSLPWWAIAVSNTATYQSGNGAFVMLILAGGLAANWLWWGAWVVWMPLVAIIWAPMWRRMRIVTTAELIELRYAGRVAKAARKAYAVLCCLIAVAVIAYITGFFAKTIAPLVPMSETRILLIFGGVTVAYTMFGGLLGVVVTDVLQFVIMMVGSVVFFFLAVSQHGGYEQIVARVAEVRPEALIESPPAPGIGLLTLAALVLQGFFFAGSPTAGEGMTAQRFMAAKSERHAMAGQLFNAFLALTFRTLPLIGLGLIATSLFWADTKHPAPPGLTMLSEPAHAWGELIRRCHLPRGLVGLLVATEVAAYMSTLSALINWGGSFVVNDLYLPLAGGSPRGQVWVSRITTLVLFVAAAVIAILFVKGMMSWFLFINSVMVIFLLPLAWFRFFWWRFNAWGELAATVLALPLSVLVWFVLDFQNDKQYEPWMGIGLLFATSFVVLFAVTWLTPAEPQAKLLEFYRRCRPPGLWGPVRRVAEQAGESLPPIWQPGRILFDCGLGIASCLGLVLATNELFVGTWTRVAIWTTMAVGCGAWLTLRILDPRLEQHNERETQ